MSDKTVSRIFEAIAESIDIPDSAYEKAEARYKDLGSWFGRAEGRCAKFDPHVYPQGSFRSGTVIRGEEYDLDFGCRLRTGITKTTHTQKQLKAIVGADMEEYRTARRIESGLKEKPRCWRLQYQEEKGFTFHMDGVPSIPVEDPQRQLLAEAMVKAGSAEVLAKDVARFAGSITDNRLPMYDQISPAWRISNSEGYALWFESRMELGLGPMERRALLESKASRVDKLPLRKGTSALQQCVKILKCHRDVMFADAPEGKPISVSITTLAAEAYQGENDVGRALEGILTNMGGLVRNTAPRIPNPVNPVEDFADKWYDPKYRHLNLEHNFLLWLEQAKSDFQIIGDSYDAEFISEQVRDKFASELNVENLRRTIELGAVSIITAPKNHRIVDHPAKPWIRW